MYSIIIPLYNELHTIPELVKRLQAVIGTFDAPVEVIMIDDCSTDGSLPLLERTHEEDRRFKVLGFSRNFGHQVAITAGLDYARGEAVVLMDGDLQDPPELLPHFVAKWKEGYQVIYAIKRSRKENVLKRMAFAGFYRLMHSFSSITIPMGAGNFSLLDRRVVEVMRGMPERNRYISGMRAWAGFRQTGIEFDREARFAGKPQMSIGRLVNLALDGLFSFSKAPLRFGIYVGLFSAGLSFIGAAYVIFAKLFTDRAILGWASTMLAITFIGGMILVTIGIIGEYIGRIYDEVKQRPLYVIETKIGFDKS
jgi:glycosyltransferase involved in cell wall biosynthesis